MAYKVVITLTPVSYRLFEKKPSQRVTSSVLPIITGTCWCKNVGMTSRILRLPSLPFPPACSTNDDIFSSDAIAQRTAAVVHSFIHRLISKKIQFFKISPLKFVCSVVPRIFTEPALLSSRQINFAAKVKP